MKHKFQDPHLRKLAKRLVELDGPKARKYRTVADTASDFGIVFTGAALDYLNDEADKESARQGKPVKEADGAKVYHPKVLETVLTMVIAPACV